MADDDVEKLFEHMDEARLAASVKATVLTASLVAGYWHELVKREVPEWVALDLCRQLFEQVTSA